MDQQPGKLIKTERNQLTKWIGQSVDYKLLYKATRDGMSPEIFHQKCDNKGPTVTVCWNTDGCVFGGYTSCNWFQVTSTTCNNCRYNLNSCPNCGEKQTVSSGCYCYDPKAFLFLLKYMRSSNVIKFPVEDSPKAIYCSVSPTFGAGPDLQIFGNQAVTKDANGVFMNKLVPKFGTSYRSGGSTMKDISNNNFNYTEVEVYHVVESVLLPHPWREDTLDKKSTIKKFIEDYCPVDGTDVKQVRILMLGAVGAGKSSYFNTINSSFRGHVTSQASTGSAEHSLTTMYRNYQVRSGSSFLKFRLCDTRGLEDTQGVDPGDIAAMLDGHLPDRYTINPFAPIKPEAAGYIKSPTLNGQIHCVAFVIDASSVDIMSETILSKFKLVQKLANQRSIPQVILLTKVDQISLEVEEDINKLLYCSRVAGVVDTVSQLIGLPRGHVLPVKNYEKETELNDVVDRFALQSLQQMLRFADDYLDLSTPNIESVKTSLRDDRCSQNWLHFPSFYLVCYVVAVLIFIFIIFLVVKSTMCSFHAYLFYFLI